jgi:hypothetical protein
MTTLRLKLLACLILTTASVTLVTQIQAAPPSPGDYIFDIAKKTPKLMTAWKRIVPRQFANVKAYMKDGTTVNWLDSVNEATSSPVDKVLLSGKRFILGQACWPHNCGGNHVVFLIAIDGSEAYGLLSSETLKVPEQYFGDPKGEMSQLLKAKMKDTLDEFDEYFKYYK